MNAFVDVQQSKIVRRKMNLTNGSANFFSEIESNCCLDLCLQSCVDVVFQVKRYLLEHQVEARFLL